MKNRIIAKEKASIQMVLAALLAMVGCVAYVNSAAAEAPPVNAPGEPPSSHSMPSSPSDDVKGTIVSPKVFFVEPKDGATVPQEFTAKFGLKGMKIGQAGTVIPGTGHHHLIVDGHPSKKGEVVGTDANHIHYGKGQTEAKLKLAPGPHTLTLQFADGAHRSYGEGMSSTISVHVK